MKKGRKVKGVGKKSNLVVAAIDDAFLAKLNEALVKRHYTMSDAIRYGLQRFIEDSKV